MNTNEKKDRLVSIYRAAKDAGIIATQKDFAEALGVNYTSISAAMNGNERALTDRFCQRVEFWAQAQGIGPENAGKTALRANYDTRPDIVIPAATMDLYTSMAKSIDRLTALLERLQPGASAYSGAYTQKNPLADRK